MIDAELRRLAVKACREARRDRALLVRFNRVLGRYDTKKGRALNTALIAILDQCLAVWTGVLKGVVAMDADLLEKLQERLRQHLRRLRSE
jgi:hypothetical protein